MLQRQRYVATDENARTDRIVLIELGRNVCSSFYCSYLWTHCKNASFPKIHVLYDDLLLLKFCMYLVAVVPALCL